VAALLEEALEAAPDQLLRSRLMARLAVELYYAEDRGRSERLSEQAVAVARAARDPTTLAAALNARHVALWRPDRLDERLAVAGEMIEVARDCDPVTELQGRNWRVVDLFELGDMDEWRAEAARHGRLARDLRLPSFEWYTPLWQSVDAQLAGRFDEAERLRLEAAELGGRAGDDNAELFSLMVRFTGRLMKREFVAEDLDFALDKVANSPAGPAYRSSVSWLLAELGRHEEARGHLAALLAPGGLPFDANWVSALREAATAAVLLADREAAAVLYDALLPYAGRPLTAGRAVTSYGVADRPLGELAALLGREADAERHLREAIALDTAMGSTVWALYGRRSLLRLHPDAELAAEVEELSEALGLVSA
jgi:hypothetical protein